jgi:hypothetical protein
MIYVIVQNYSIQEYWKLFFFTEHHTAYKPSLYTKHPWEIYRKVADPIQKNQC